MGAAANPVSYRALPSFFYSDVAPEVLGEAKTLALNHDLADELGLGADWLGTKDALSVLSGSTVLGGGDALAMAYGGHQFGQWSGLLGDGRARLAGEAKDSAGHLHELQLKGSGQTPYSRRGDGKATLGATIREYIVSEAMAALGVPTTRALSIVTTGENIVRQGPEPGAILCRSARSHIRVGTFQLAAASGETENIKALADFAIERLYPDVAAKGPERYREFYRQVIAAQADLIARWMGFGFIHGVMNTDNMCISGETIDYGPCAYLDDFHPGKAFSSIDRQGRYAWGRQPEMGHWNLARLAETLMPLLGADEDAGHAAAEEDLSTFVPLFQAAFNDVLARKFGLKKVPETGDNFIAASFEAMTEGKVDFTQFFRHLTRIAAGESGSQFSNLFEDKDAGTAWLESWKQVTGFKNKLPKTRAEAMQAANPIIIARNHRVEQAIKDANAGNPETFKNLLAAISDPFAERAEFAEYEVPPKVDEIVHQTFCGT